MRVWSDKADMGSSGWEVRRSFTLFVAALDSPVPGYALHMCHAIISMDREGSKEQMPRSCGFGRPRSEPQTHPAGMDFYVCLERPGFRVARRRRTKNKVGVQHKVTKEDAIKW